MNASKVLKEFLVEDFSTWWIRLNRGRISNNENEIDRNAALSVMYGVLVAFTKLAAPIIPFITEEIYRNIAFDESVHLSNYPLGDKSLIDEQLMKDMELVRDAVEVGHAARKNSAIKLRQPLRRVAFRFNNSYWSPSSDELKNIIKAELNVKEIVVDELAEEIRKGSFVPAEGKNKNEAILDTEINEELRKEGDAREIMRTIQQLRKNEGLTLQDRIEVILPDWPVEHEEMIKKAVQANSLTKGEVLSIKKV